MIKFVAEATLTKPAVDAYRSKQRSALVAAGQEESAIPAHLEGRPGKRRWLERSKAMDHPMTPPNPSSV